jgi:RNase P protein component
MMKSNKLKSSKNFSIIIKKKFKWKIKNKMNWSIKNQKKEILIKLIILNKNICKYILHFYLLLS